MKRQFTHIILVIMVIAGIGNSKAQDSARILNLNDCIQIGLQRSRQILISEDSVLITGAMLMGAYGRFLPDLNYNADLMHNSGRNLVILTVPTLVNSTGTTLSYQLSSTVNIFNGFHDYSQLKEAMIAKSAQEFNLIRAKQQIALDITQAFLQVILDRRVVQYARENLAASITREQELNKLTAVGRTAISDLYEQQAETSRDSLYDIQSENKLRDDIILLFRKIEITETEKYRIADVAMDSLPFGAEYQNVQDLINEAMHSRPDLKSSGLYINIQDWNIKDAKSGYWPKIAFEGSLNSDGGRLTSLSLNGVDQSAALATQEPPVQSYFGQIYGLAELTFTWQIFDRLVTGTNVKLAKIYMRNAQINYDDLSVQISADIKTSYNDYLSALQQTSTADRGLIAARQAYNTVLGKYFVGRTSFVDLSNAQANLLQAEVSKAQADIGLALEKKTLDFYIGK